MKKIWWAILLITFAFLIALVVYEPFRALIMNGIADVFGVRVAGALATFGAWFGDMPFWVQFLGWGGIWLGIAVCVHQLWKRRPAILKPATSQPAYTPQGAPAFTPQPIVQPKQEPAKEEASK